MKKYFLVTFEVLTDYGKRRNNAVVEATDPQTAIELFKSKIPEMGILWGSCYPAAYRYFLTFPLQETRFAQSGYIVR